MKKYIKLIRANQWIKNLFVFAPLVFSLHLFEFDYFEFSFYAFLLFCLASSIVYIINDIYDADADRAHPIKKERPIASGTISVKKGLILAAVMFFVLIIMLTYFSIEFIFIVIAFFLLNIFYTFYLKHIVLLDIFSIAAGFILRVVGGAYAIEVPISNWLLITTMFVSLFLAIMKRRSELVLIEEKKLMETRKVLEYYSIHFTDQMATIAAAAVIISYALYTVAIKTVAHFGTENLIFTTPFVVFGIFRYLYIVFQLHKGENASEILVKDVPMLINIVLYIVVTVVIIYKYLPA